VSTRLCAIGSGNKLINKAQILPSNGPEKERVNDIFDGGLNANQRVNHFRLYTEVQILIILVV
jgi:hypothetical protein